MLGIDERLTVDSGPRRVICNIRRQEGGERCRTLHMPPGLQPLGDDRIDASRRRLGFLD